MFITVRLQLKKFSMCFLRVHKSTWTGSYLIANKITVGLTIQKLLKLTVFVQQHGSEALAQQHCSEVWFRNTAQVWFRNTAWNSTLLWGESRTALTACLNSFTFTHFHLWELSTRCAYCAPLYKQPHMTSHVSERLVCSRNQFYCKSFTLGN